MFLFSKDPIRLNREEYRDKVYACWIGKNIGGTMGAPYEAKREMQNITGFSTPPNCPLPNDDLDLQLIWLHAMEEVGPWSLDTTVLAENWISHISPTWNEYGLGKANLQAGLLPPLSGDFRNDFKNSNGAWIRTEIWACLAPACPDAAVRYAYEDAIVDHGTAEGTHAAVFIAAMESAAFVETDLRKLIDIGLSRIPEDCRMARSIRLLLDCYDKGTPWRETRNIIQQENADIGDGWFEAPSNVAYAILGLLYGEGDYKKSMTTAINCGDDTDCTGATVGSLLGIMGGTAAIPTDWREHIGDGISTMSISRGVVADIPNTCAELTDHVVKLAPTVLLANRAGVEFTDEETFVSEARYQELKQQIQAPEYGTDRPANSYRIRCGFFCAEVTFPDEPVIAPGESLTFSVRFFTIKNRANVDIYGNFPLLLSLKWFLPEGWQISGPLCVKLPHTTWHVNGEATVNYTVTAGETCEAINRLVLQVVAPGRPSTGLIPVNLLG